MPVPRGAASVAAPRRAASALLHRRPDQEQVGAERQRAASATAMREQLRREARHEGGQRAAAAPGPAAPTAASHAPAAGGGRQPWAGSRAGSRLGANKPWPPPPPPAAPRARPGSAAVWALGVRPPPAAPQQLPALHEGRPPSRMERYAGERDRSAQLAAGAEPKAARRGSAGTVPQALPPVRPFSAKPAPAGSGCLGSSRGAAVSPAGQSAAQADIAALFAVAREAHGEAPQAPRQHQDAEGTAEQQATQLQQRLVGVTDGPERQAAAEDTAAWIAGQLQSHAADLFRNLLTALAAGASATGASAGGDAAPAGSASAPPSATLPGSQRPHQLFQQCSQLRGEKAALERLNADLSSQVGRGGLDCPHTTPHWLTCTPTCTRPRTGHGIPAAAGGAAPACRQSAAGAAAPAGGGGRAGGGGAGIVVHTCSCQEVGSARICLAKL